MQYNISSNLAKRILVFVSDDQKVALRSKELRKWLLNCGYLESVINKSFFNAKLQGSANKSANSKCLKNILKTFYFYCLHIIQTLICET